MRVIDFMPVRDRYPELIRIVECLEGHVRMRTESVVRFDYGSVVPWLRRIEDGSLLAVGGPDALCVRTPIELHGEAMTPRRGLQRAQGRPGAVRGDLVPVARPVPEAADAEQSAARDGAVLARLDAPLPLRRRLSGCGRTSLMVLKAQTYAPTGGIVAAPTTSLPEWIGGPRNWDYRYCWVRDATFTLYAMMNAGYIDEARAWRDWLLRAAAGDPSKLQIMYGLFGERRLNEYTLPWLPGYPGSKPVRVGNAASGQFQLDVYGEVVNAMYAARLKGLQPDDAGDAWRSGGHCSTRSSSCGTSRTRASERPAARVSSSSRRRSWPGSPSTTGSRRSTSMA